MNMDNYRVGSTGKYVSMDNTGSALGGKYMSMDNYIRR